MGYIIGVIIWGIIWGYATNAVISNKGYSENWFWWGFFFGVIAFLVALTKPDVRMSTVENNNTYTDTINFLQGVESERHRQLDGAWLCEKCNAMNPSYVGTCGCGITKIENDQLKKQKAEKQAKKIQEEKEVTEKTDTLSESEKADALLKYKNLLDVGAITEEEYNLKKAELLGINPVYKSTEPTEPLEKTINLDREYTQTEKMILSVLDKNSDGISSMSLSQAIPRSVPPKEVMDALRNLEESGEVIKGEYGKYIKK